MKIYTKTGDKGQTSLIGGTRVPKHDIRIEAYGTVDELNAHIGLLRDVITQTPVRDTLLEIQDRLFTMGSILATDQKSKMKIPSLSEEDIALLEKEIDRINDALPPMRSFVLPGGHTTVSFCHIARCVCRRAERRVNELVLENLLVLKYLNRLSDYLFMLSRKMASELKIEEIPWKPRL